MKTSTRYPTTVISRWARVLGTMLTLALMVSVTAFSYNNPTAVPLLTAGTYGALSYAGMTGVAVVTGDIGSSTSSIEGTVTCTGTNWTTVNNAHNLQAQTDLGTALSDVINTTTYPSNATITADALGGLVLHHGVYDGTALDLAAGLTLELNGDDDPNAVFIIRAATSLTINLGGVVSLTHGAVWSNVFWYVGSSATVYGSSSTFKGIILAQQSITVYSGSTVTARLLANGAAVTINSTVLPVELVSFTATASGMNTNLHWSTATEINNSGFEIQRRQTGDWAKVGFVAGAGTSNAPRNYSYTDSKLSAGSYAYRLKQIDNNGAFTYGSTVEVAISSAPAAFALSQNYPNPFNPSTVISYSLEKAGMVSLRVYNMLGQEVATLVNGPQEAGVYSVPFNTSKALGLSSGVYVYRLEAGSFVSTKKLVLMK